jgi:hypothetical protein
MDLLLQWETKLRIGEGVKQNTKTASISGIEGRVIAIGKVPGGEDAFKLKVQEKQTIKHNILL